MFTVTLVITLLWCGVLLGREALGRRPLSWSAALGAVSALAVLTTLTAAVSR